MKAKSEKVANSKTAIHLATVLVKVVAILEPLSPEERQKVIESTKAVLDIKPPVVYRSPFAKVGK